MQSVYYTEPADWVKGEPYSSAEMQSVYSRDPADRVKGESYSSAEMQSVYSTEPADRVKGEPYSSAEIQSVYSTDPADWAIEDMESLILHLYLHYLRCFIKYSLYMVLYQIFQANTNNLHKVEYFQVFFARSNDYMVSSNYFF